MQRKFIVTPTGDKDKLGNSMHRLLPRFRHRHREPSRLVGSPPTRVR